VSRANKKHIANIKGIWARIPGPRNVCDISPELLGDLGARVAAHNGVVQTFCNWWPRFGSSTHQTQQAAHKKHSSHLVGGVEEIVASWSLFARISSPN
jgi:hypothetical protein